MDDHHKTKAQLTAELQALRRLLAGPQGSGAVAASRTPRLGLDTEIEFIGDFDVIKAYGVDISESGICFEVADSLSFEMRFVHQGEVCQHRAHLIWMKQVDGERCRMGFRFVTPEKACPPRATEDANARDQSAAGRRR